MGYSDYSNYLKQCEVYRNPAGAVPAGVSVDVSINISYGEIKNVYLVLIYNDGGSKYYELNKISGLDCAYNYSLDSLSKGLYFYYFEIEYQDSNREYCYKDGRLEYPDDNAKKWQITVYDKDFKTPEAFKGGIMYHIFVDRFAKSDAWNPEIREGFYQHEDLSETPFYKPDEYGKVKNEDVYGGSLAGIIEKLDYLKELSVDIIYLSPIFEANSNHKYNTADYEKIDSMFGNDEIFDMLIKEADKRDIKIILDGVFNHTGDDSVYFNKYGRYSSQGAYQSKESPYYDWYMFNDWDNNRDDYECWWGIPSVPSIRKEQPVFRGYICGVNGIIEKWIKRGVAGYRIDVADELSDRMLKGINKAVKETSPESIIIGEIWEDASNKIAYGQRRQYLLGNQLDSVMNYPLKEAIINYLRTGNSYVMSEVMDMIVFNYPKQSIDCLINVIGTHDTMRILTALGSENYAYDKDVMAESRMSESERARGVFLLKSAVLMQMTLPGIPCIYYGDEAGAEGYGDPFNRRFFPWGNIDEDIFDFYKKICAIRKENRKIFAKGDYRLVYKESGVFFYKRIKDGEEIYVCVNLSGGDYDLGDVYGSFLNTDSNSDEITQVGAGRYDLLFFLRKKEK